MTNYLVPDYGYEEIQLAREQVRMGHHTIIIASNYLHPKGPYSVLRRRFKSRKVKPGEQLIDEVAINRLPSYEVAHRAWIRGLVKSLLDFDPDVIHCHNLLQFHPGRVAMLRALGRYRGVVVVDDHMHYGFMRQTLLGRSFYAVYRTLGQPIIARYVDRFCAIAEDTREYLRSECGVTGEINVVPLGVAVGAFTPDPVKRREARRRLGLDDSELTFIYTGKVIPAKGVHLLVEAAAQLSSGLAKISVLVVGDADESYEQHLITAATANGGRVNLHLIPSVDHRSLPDWYAAADVGVWPRQESMAAFEAMAAGLPVVVSAASGLAGIVAPDRGLTYGPETGTALAACLRQLTADELRQRLGHAGRAYTEAEISWHRSAERYVGIYREAITDRTTR